MLTAAVVVPLAGALALIALPRTGELRLRVAATVVATVPLVISIVAWIRFDTGSAEMFQLREEADWIPALGVGWRMGVDGISLALTVVSSLVFLVAIGYPVDTHGRPRQYYAWMLFLEGTSLGLFLTTDLLLFYVFFDLSLVGMYFLIARWGHGDRERSALTFFVYTLGGSLVMLLGILGLYLRTDPLTFDMEAIIRAQPLSGGGARAALVLVALCVGLAVKTPLVPVHSWLPPAHVDAPGPASAILAGVLLKMGTYGLVRLPFSMMRSTFVGAAPVLAVLATIGIVYGASVALAQDNLKMRIAYTSVNHMGYAVLGIAVAGALATGDADARRLALTGATIEMVAHALSTGALFLMAESFWQRTQDYDIGSYGGLAAPAPRLAAFMTIAAFASLGLPGLAGFVAEVQVLAGAIQVYPVAGVVALLGLLVTAALFLQMIQRLFFGEAPAARAGFPDLRPVETVALTVMLVLVVAIGVFPRALLDLVQSTADHLVGAA